MVGSLVSEAVSRLTKQGLDNAPGVADGHWGAGPGGGVADVEWPQGLGEAS